MNIINVDPITDTLWQKLVNHQQSDVFHSPNWIQVIADTYNFDLQAYILLDEAGEPQAGIPFCRIEDVKQKRIVTLPFSDYCDPLVENSEQWRRLTDKLLAEHCSFTIRCLHNSVPLTDNRFTLVNKAKWHGLDLQPDLDTLFKNIPKKSRWGIRKAQRDGVTVRIAEGKEELRAFFEMHLGVRKYKYRLLAQPYRFFENIWRYILEKQGGFLMIAEYQGEIIGGVLFLEWKDTLYYKFSTSNPAYISKGATDVLIWKGVEHAKSKGYTQFDFGLSDWDQEGLIRYKRKFTSKEKTISFLRHVPNGGPTYQERQLHSLFPQLTDLLTDKAVPDPITERGGDILYRFFT